MSEWYDSQKKPKVDFLKFLQECLDKANIRCEELTEKEKENRDKLSGIFDKLRCG